MFQILALTLGLSIYETHESQPLFNKLTTSSLAVTVLGK